MSAKIDERHLGRRYEPSIEISFLPPLWRTRG